MSSCQDHSVPSLSSLPPEILEKIFLESENLDLQKASRRLYYVLNDDIVLLRFCTKIFYEGRLSEDVKVTNLQNSILSHPCFTPDFAARVEQAVLKLQEPDQAMLPIKGSVWNDYSERNKVRLADGTHLPRRLLLGPWTEDNINLLNRLLRWDAVLNRKDIDAAHCAVVNAIIEAQPKVVELLRQWVEVDQNHLRLAVTKGGCDISVIRMIAADIEYFAPELDWRDEEIVHWAEVEAKLGNDRALWLLKVIASDGWALASVILRSES